MGRYKDDSIMVLDGHLTVPRVHRGSQSGRWHPNLEIFMRPPSSNMKLAGLSGVMLVVADPLMTNPCIPSTSGRVLAGSRTVVDSPLLHFK